MSKLGCPDRFVKIIRLFHDGMMARVLDDGNASDPFQATNGVKQGCVLAPTLFSLMLSAMLTDAFKETSPGIPINYRCDGKLFNLRRLQAITKVKKIMIRDLSLLMTVPSIPTTSKRCNRRWTHSPLPVTTSVSPSTPKRLKWCTSPPQESHTRNQTQWRARGSKRWRTSPTSAAHSPALPT